MRIEEFDFTLNLTQSLQWQRNQAVNLPGLINAKQAWYDTYHTQFWQDWCSDIFNLVTANEFGLSVWCILLNIPNFIINIPDLDKPIWGFNETPPINNFVNFNNGNFTSQDFPELFLSLEEQRILLRLRYFQLITFAGIPETNSFLDIIFNDPDGILQGGAWCIDNFDMTIQYVFNCPISANLLAIIQQYGILPRGTGVGITYEVL